MNTIEESAQQITHLAKPGKYLTFTLDKESYGVEVLRVREIIKLQEITPVPQMPAYVKGVLNLRGKIIPVIDLRVKFELSNTQVTESTCIIVVHFTNGDGLQTQMGIIVDGVEEVLNIAESEIEDTPNFGSTLQTHYILGMAKIRGAVKTLLDINKVISTEDIMQLHHVAGIKPEKITK